MALANLYPARPGPRKIRLLELVSPPDADVPAYNLKEHSLDSDKETSFEALSYVWGDPTVRRELTVEGQTVAVTVNLWNALRQLAVRSGFHPPLWVDALCVNQEDLVEREEQASLVGEIYGGAARVVVWLGPDPEGECTEAPELVEMIYKKCEQMAKERGQEILPFAHELAQVSEDEAFLDVSPSKIVTAMGQANIPQSAWQSLRRLFDSKWFTRIWCVQEIGFAKCGLLFLGAMEPILWERLAVVITWYKAQDLNRKGYELPLIMKGSMYYYGLNMFIGVHVDGHEGAEALVAALWRFHPFKATDPRDKVYGLVGLLRKSGTELPVEIRYVDTSIADVCTAVAMALIEERGDLKILASIHHSSANVDVDVRDDIPSWVPRWDGGSGLLALDRGFKPGVIPTACGPHIDAEISDSRPGTLQLKGLSFGQVEYVSRLMARDLFSVNDDMENEAWAGLGLFIDLWNHATADDADEGSIDRLARTLTAGNHARRLHKPSAEELEQFHSDFLGWMALVFEKRGIEPQTGVSPTNLLNGRDAYPMQFARLARMYCQERRIFWTSSGFMGLGPPGMEGGHEVVILRGGSTPYVLKQRGDEWLYVGDSYIDEIMFGECYSGKVKGWTQPEEREFRLV